MSTLTTGRIVAERWVLACFSALFAGTLLWVALSALHLSNIVALIVSAVVAAALCLLWKNRLSPQWNDTLPGNALPILWVLLAIATLARLIGVAMFMANPKHAQASTYWFDTFYIRHNCFSGYWHAASLADQGTANIYELSHYAGTVSQFKLDEFLYFPQFLLLPMLGVAAGADFDQARALWFVIEAGALALCMLGTYHWLGGVVGKRAALLLPFVWIAAPTLLTLQLGNFQLSAISLSAFAMALFWRDKPILGGALFGFAVFKLFPGILGIYLIATRRWRAVGWTLAFASFYSVITYLWLGENPYRALFEHHLPRLANGDAWAFLEIKELAPVAAINDSIPGIVYKLNALGVPGMTRGLSLAIAWGWTLLIVVLTVLAARRSPRMSRAELLASWISLLALASFRSPFLPDHSGLFAPLWLWSIVAAGSIIGGWRIALFGFAWLALATVLPFVGTPLAEGLDRFAVSAISQAVAVGLCLWVVLRRPSGNTSNGTVTAAATPFSRVATT